MFALALSKALGGAGAPNTRMEGKDGADAKAGIDMS